MQADDPELFADLYRRIGDLMAGIWQRFLAPYADVFAICRFGDDLGFKTSTLVSPRIIRQHIIPQYRRIIDLIHAADRPFLWHSCGCIFSVMDDVIALGIQAKHSNEDGIAAYEQWIERYGERIGLLGGIDLDILCVKTPAEVYDIVLERGTKLSPPGAGLRARLGQLDPGLRAGGRLSRHDPRGAGDPCG